MAESNLYRFKDIKKVIDAKELVDVVLSKTQRKTPTEIHKGFRITRIRSFYMRKVKFCQELFREKLNAIINEFPRLDDIHPFYGDLVNILYDRDHYKLALGQCNYTNKAIHKISHDYIKLLKFSSSLYKCKMLKIAALGRMCKIVKKLQPSLTYLEEVRQNLSRLPSINPHNKSIILTGYPNVGKSSCMNILTRATVDVQPYPFTTKNIYVGHFEHDLSKYQVIDTAGLLDRSLENRNTIEMTTISALAHIDSALVFFLIDVSEDCGYTIQSQVELFFSIRALFENKPILIGLNKIDRVSVNTLSEENQKFIQRIADESKTDFVKFAPMSTLTGVGVEEAKLMACDLLKKVKASSSGFLNKKQLLEKKLEEMATNPNRPPYIPESVLRERLERTQAEAQKQKETMANGTVPLGVSAEVASLFGGVSEEGGSTRIGNGETFDANEENEEVKKPMTLREMKLLKKNKNRQSYLSNRKNDKILKIDLQNMNGGAGVYSVDIRENYDINEDYKYDVIPEIYNGKNISDFIDEDIEDKLMMLEKEEEELLEKDVEINPLWYKTQNIISRMSLRLKGIREEARLNREKEPVYHKRKKTVEEMEKKLDELQIKNKDSILNRMTEKSRKNNSEAKQKRADLLKKVKKEISKHKQLTNDPFKNMNPKSKIFESTSTELQRVKAFKMNQLALRKIEKGRKGEADRSIPAWKPRHLFSGKRKIGKTSRR